MFVTELSPEYQQQLEELTETLQENFTRAFKNEAVRNERRKSFTKSVHKLDAILLSLNDTKIELSNLKLLWFPDFRIENFDLNLSKLNLDLELKLGDLKVEGNYDVNNLAVQKLLPITTTGKVLIDFSKVTCKSRVGLNIEGDSFVPLNHDVGYQYDQTEVTANYFVDKDTQIQNKITHGANEKCIGEAVWLQLEGILTQILHEQLATVVTEFSVSESLADEDEELRYFAKSQSSKANRMFDSLLCTAKDYLVEKKHRSITSPAFDVVYRGKVTSVEQGTFETNEGYLQDLSSLSRLQDSSIYENDTHIFLYGYLSLRDFKHGYEHFTSRFEGTEVEGSIKTAIYKSKIFVKFSVDKQDVSAQKELVRLKVIATDDIDVDTSGLASLSWLVPKVQSWTVGHFRTNALPVLEAHLKEAFAHALYVDWRKEHQVKDLEVDTSYQVTFWRNVFTKSSFYNH